VTSPVSLLRWPLHPPPSAGEALASWTARLAALYGMTPGYLLRHGLGAASALLDDPRAHDLDFDPAAEIRQVLAERTGVDPGVVRLTTIAGWMSWLADSLDPYDGQEAFDSYVRQHSVLLGPRARPGAARSRTGFPGYRRTTRNGGPRSGSARHAPVTRPAAPACWPCCPS
jgi:TniQ protein